MSIERKGMPKDNPTYTSPYGYYKVRIIDPTLIKTYQPPHGGWHDVGKPGNLAHVRGTHKKTGEITTQALRLEKNHWMSSPDGMQLLPITKRAKEALRSIERQYGYQVAFIQKDKDWQLVPKVIGKLSPVSEKRAWLASQILQLGMPESVTPKELIWTKPMWILQI
jgi:hypothetical protein